MRIGRQVRPLIDRKANNSNKRKCPLLLPVFCHIYTSDTHTYVLCVAKATHNHKESKRSTARQPRQYLPARRLAELNSTAAAPCAHPRALFEVPEPVWHEPTHASTQHNPVKVWSDSPSSKQDTTARGSANANGSRAVINLSSKSIADGDQHSPMTAPGGGTEHWGSTPHR